MGPRLLRNLWDRRSGYVVCQAAGQAIRLRCGPPVVSRLIGVGLMKRRLFLRTAVGLAAISALLAMALATTGRLQSAQAKAKGYLQITSVKMSPDTLHLDRAGGPTCGTGTVQLLVNRAKDLSDPAVTVSLSEYSSTRPGVRVSVLPHSGIGVTATVGSGATEGTFTFSICSTGGKAGKVTLQANIIQWKPPSEYDIEYPAPAERGRTSFTVAE